jgi:hypothetical protein
MSKIDDYGYVDFKTIKEGWSEYSLEDGTIIRARVLLLKIVREGHDFKFNEESFATVFCPPESKGPLGSSKISPDEMAKIVVSLKNEDVNVIISKEYWNEYELNTGDKVSSKVVLVSTSQTDRYDEIGDPIYTIQLQTLHKVIQKRDHIEEK